MSARRGGTLSIIGVYPESAEVFPIGSTLYGTLYGDDVSLLIPDEEENNPEYQGACL